MVKKTLQDVLANIPHAELNDEQLNFPIANLKLDSRKLHSGETFVAVPGYATDGRNFIAEAFAVGAALVIAEAENNQSFIAQLKQHTQINHQKIIWIKNLRSQISLLAANYYDHPSHNLKVIGVTGTNGKTSCTYLISQALQKLNFECYLFGSLGLGQSSHLQSSENTTADAITVQQVLADAVNRGVQFAAMEVSSHGIAQKRVASLKFHTAVFTNLTHDHLDFHGSIQNYAATKRQLFISEGLQNVVLNMDDKMGRKLYEDEAIQAVKWLVTTHQPTSGSNLNRWIWAENIKLSLQGIQAKVYTPWGSGDLDSALIGEFNLSNLLLVIATLGSILKDIKQVLAITKQLKPAVGRMQKIEMRNAPLVIVDYAHTPDALQKILQSLREHCVGLIWCVFGCGGDRDTAKRALMARVAEKYSNRVLVTLDNPRTEAPQTICDDIFKGFKQPDKVKYIDNRQQAIETVIAKASPDDAILIAGKGHEDYQIIGKRKIHLSDIEISTNAVNRRAYG